MLLNPQEGDTLRSPSGVETCVYDLATCTETGKAVVIHGNKGGTMTTPNDKIDRSWKVTTKGGRTWR